jgi:hypothetical protein
MLMEIYVLVWDRHKNMVDETSYIMATSFSGGRSQRTIDHEQANGKLYHLRLRVE